MGCGGERRPQPWQSSSKSDEKLTGVKRKLQRKDTLSLLALGRFEASGNTHLGPMSVGFPGKRRDASVTSRRPLTAQVEPKVVFLPVDTWRGQCLVFSIISLHSQPRVCLRASFGPDLMDYTLDL